MPPASDLARQAADLLSVANLSQPRSLNQLVTLACDHLGACCGATADLWQDGEQVALVASHPDLPELIEAQIGSGRGPVYEALDSADPVNCPDTLEETRWPEYAGAALRHGVRCSVTLASPQAGGAVTISLFAARPRQLGSGQRDLAELLIAFGGTVVGNAADYGDARRTASQLRAAADARTLVDQAKGMLMQARGCTADDALAWMRRVSQERNVRVADVARKVIESGGAQDLRPSASGVSPAARPRR
jgi:hypothetical protein